MIEIMCQSTNEPINQSTLRACVRIDMDEVDSCDQSSRRSKRDSNRGGLAQWQSGAHAQTRKREREREFERETERTNVRSDVQLVQVS